MPIIVTRRKPRKPVGYKAAPVDKEQWAESIKRILEERAELWKRLANR